MKRNLIKMYLMYFVFRILTQNRHGAAEKVRNKNPRPVKPGVDQDLKYSCQDKQVSGCTVSC
jgi:hypothetical protein